MLERADVWRGLPWILLLGIAAVPLFFSGCEGGRGSATTVPRPTFVETATCAKCHADQHGKWMGSDHQLAMQLADEKSVLGNFNDAPFTHQGVTSSFFRKDGKFMVRTDGPDGKLTDFEIKYTFGVRPLQQYLIELDRGRLQALTICWDTKNKQWYHLYPNEKIPHDDELHWTGPNFNWNYMCADCHSTHLRKNYDLVTDSYKTEFSHINVDCQACHGPGSAHVDWAEARQRGEQKETALKGLTVSLKNADTVALTENCARCHARRHLIHAPFEHGERFLDHQRPQLLAENLYHADGQILDEVYVYGSFVQSPMYHRGVKCTDCHDPHTARVRADGNALCVQCHNPAPPKDRFPTLKPADYQATAHHHHMPGTPGASCVECHMPSKTYMQVDPRRDHSFRVPRPDLTVKIGTPNACSHCHQDKGAKWAADAVATWFPGGRQTTPHFAEVFNAARQGRPEAGTALAAIIGNDQQPAIVRSTALFHLRAFGPRASVTAAATSVSDPDPLVRSVAAGGIEGVAPQSRLLLLAPLMTDPVRAVRIEAARALVTVPAEMFTPEQRSAYDKALAEFVTAQGVTADRPGSHLNLAVLAADQGDRAKAEAEYRAALQLDPNFLPARMNLANFYNTAGRNDEAEKQLREVVRQAPTSGDGFYSLGLLLAEMNRLEEAATHLGRAAALMPDRVRIRYNHALALQRLHRYDEAEVALLKAYQTEPGNSDVVGALMHFYVEKRQWKDAQPYLDMLLQRAPNHPELLEMQRKIQAGLNDQ